VRRVRHTKAQTGLDAIDRRRNMKAAFDAEGALEFRHPLVIDDVITTGETCRQLAATLLRAGAEKVSVLAVARAAST
jgi:predicted amidophosphoribosyltransferase